jgi:hypothetical protein
VRFPHLNAAGKRAWQREALEIKVWSRGRVDPLAKGLAQLETYLDRLGLDHGVLAIFDRKPSAPSIEERTRFEEAHTEKGYPVTVLRA